MCQKMIYTKQEKGFLTRKAVKICGKCKNWKRVINKDGQCRVLSFAPGVPMFCEEFENAQGCKHYGERQ